MTNKNSVLKWIIWALAAFFYFYEYLLRVSPSVMVPELMNAFGVDAAVLGVIVSSYYYAYAPMQLPVGLLIDRFGAKNLLTFAAFVCAIGAVLFGVANHFLSAATGRFFIGFGSSFAFVAMVYVCSHWFPASKRALLVGLANSIGMLGAFSGQGPLSFVLHNVNWRAALIALGFLGVFLAIVIYFTIETEKSPSHSPMNYSHSFKSLLSGLKTLCKNKATWLNAFITLLFYTTTSAIADLWGVPFLQSAYHLSKHSAGFAISMIFIGWLFGGPTIGFISDKIRTRIKIIALCIGLTILSLLSVVYLTGMPLPLLYFALFCIGFFSSGELLNFTLATELNPHKIKGSAIAFTNFVVSCGSGFIQPIIGVFLDMTWSGEKENGINIYTTAGYQKAFLILPIFLCLALVLCYFLKEGKLKEHGSEPLSGD